MYQAHFGLKKALFDSGIAQGASVFLGAKQQAVAANAKVALSTLDSVRVLTGPAGVGKTTVASAALRESSTRLALGWLGGTPANASELLELLLVEFGVDAPRAGRMERLQMWREFLNETNATDSRVFVIVERADDMNAALLRALESFTAADPNGCAGANVVLLGGDALAEQLKAPALDSLRQRVRLRQRLEPLGIDELRAYLAHHVTLAGGTFDRVFAGDALEAVHRYTGGVPRLVNNLCETALTLAASNSEPQVAGELVTKAATGLLGLDDTTAPTEPAARDVAATAPTERANRDPAATAPTESTHRDVGAPAPQPHEPQPRPQLQRAAVFAPMAGSGTSSAAPTP
ncbi:MAG TPA: AAA family ATPase, partial [Gammaproteobacteria bacterium]|nr:AAA family ATPase [Gammaproteobacteria bacterium]